jgi:hypothetical protein
MHRARHVARAELVPRRAIGAPAHIEDADLGSVQVVGEPFGAGEELGAGVPGQGGSLGDRAEVG